MAEVIKKKRGPKPKTEKVDNEKKVPKKRGRKPKSETLKASIDIPPKLPKKGGVNLKKL